MDNQIELSGVPPHGIEPIRDQLLQVLKGCERYTNGRYTADSMIALCEEGRSLLFIAFDLPDGQLRIRGAVICAINVYPLRTMLLIQFLGGDSAKAWVQNMYSLLERFARDNGCNGLEWTGRMGWLRLLPQFNLIGVTGEVDFVEGGRESADSTDGNPD